MDHRLFKRVSAASATQFVPLLPSLSLSFLSLSLFLSIYSVCLSPFSLQPSISSWGLSLLPSLPTTRVLTLIFRSDSPTPPPCPPSLPSPSLLLDACLHEGCRLEPQVDWEAQTFRAEFQTNDMLLNESVTATLNRHFYDSPSISFYIYIFCLFICFKKI